jgi:tetratricopeptide (TPR) repeat protein
MGAVYQAWDQTLEVAVALKIVLPEATPDPATAEDLERRFKRELLLARQVTHKNVVRIHDLGEIDGIKYITMPYVQGSNLSTILKRDGRMPVERALPIVKDVVSGLVAAHAAAVVHRDLKPANIMIDVEGNPLIMDFGIARSTSGATGFNVTAVGAIVGTMEYMAPEQARGDPVDGRADVYSLGLILNDMLLGRRQGSATGVAELLARMAQPPPSLRSVDPTIPPAVDAIVTKCVQPDPAARFQSMSELAAALDALDRNGNPIHEDAGTDRDRGRFAGKKLWAAAGLVAALAIGGWMARGRWLSTPAPKTSAGPVVTLAVLPFRNASGDVTLDTLGSSVSEVLRTELGQSSRVRTVPSDRMGQVLLDLRIAANATLAPTELARVADLTNARRVLWGQFTRFGNAIRIDATLQDLDRGETVPLNAMAPNENGLLAAISELAGAVRQNLARGSPDILSELKSSAWKPTTSSLDALRLYNEGQLLTQQGNHQEALKRFEAATKQDGNFALAYSALARSYFTLGYETEAAQFSRRAVDLSEALPPQEKYLIAANQSRIAHDASKAIESYENLVKAAPNSASVQFDLGSLYEDNDELDKAKARFAKVVELDPKFVEGLLALGRVEIKLGHPEDSLQPLNTALTLAIQLNLDEARANILQAIGIAYRQEKPEEALKRFQESLEIKKQLGDKSGMAASLNEISMVQQALGKRAEAEQSLNDALTFEREIGEKGGIANTLINLATLSADALGRPGEALPLLQEALQIYRDTRNQSGEALVLNNLGNVYLAKGQYSDAQTYFERALELRQKLKATPDDIADVQHNLAETLLKNGHPDQALSRYLQALNLRRGFGNRRGAAIESYSIGSVFDSQGRFGAAVKSKEEALAAFRELKQHDMWFGEILGGYGNSLSLCGRLDEAGRSLNEALAVARELNNPTLIAQTLRFQAERLSYTGDAKGASRVAAEAANAAERASDRGLTLTAKTVVAMTAAAVQPSRSLATQLGALSQEADSLGLQYLSVDAAIHRARTLIKTGDISSARQEADRILARAETLGFRLLLANAHHVRGELLRIAGDSQASAEYAAALRLLDEMKADEGNQTVLARADLSAMREDCLRWSRS